MLHLRGWLLPPMPWYSYVHPLPPHDTELVWRNCACLHNAHPPPYIHQWHTNWTPQQPPITQNTWSEDQHIQLILRWAHTHPHRKYLCGKNPNGKNQHRKRPLKHCSQTAQCYKPPLLQVPFWSCAASLRNLHFGQGMPSAQLPVCNMWNTAHPREKCSSGTVVTAVLVMHGGWSLYPGTTKKAINLVRI